MNGSAEVWTWTILAAIGVAVQTWLVLDSIRRLRALGSLGLNGDRRRVLVGHLRSGLCYLAMHAIFLYVGLRVLIGFNFGAIAWLFIASAFFLLYAGLADWGDRRYWRHRRRHDD